MKLREPGQNRECEVEILERQDGWLRVRIDGREVLAELKTQATGSMITIRDRRFHIASARRKDIIMVTVGPRTFDFIRVEEGRHRAHGLSSAEITAPMPGKVLRVLVKTGDLVTAGQPLVVLEAMKMETALAAESEAIVKGVPVIVGQMVDHGAVLIELSPPPANSSARESGSRAQ